MTSPPTHAHGGMTAVKVCTLLLLIVQGATFWYLMGSVIFPVVIVLISAWVVLTGARLEISDTVRFRLCAVAAALFIVKSRIAPIPIRGGSVTSITQFSFAVGQFLMLLQLVALATSKRNRAVLPQAIPWLAAATMVCAGNIYVDEIQRSMFQVMVLVFVTLAALYSALNRQMYARDGARLRTPILGLSVAAVGVLGWWSSLSLYDHSRDLETLISNLIDPQALPQESGFTTQGRLRSIVKFRDKNADSVAMRVYSQSPPGYLRGFVFGDFSEPMHEWLPDKLPDHLVTPSELQDIPRGQGENAFSLSPARDVTPDSSMQIWALHDMETVIFLPQNAAWVTAEVDNLPITGEGNLTAPNLPIGYPYTIHTTTEPLATTLTDADITKYGYTNEQPIPEVARKLSQQLMQPNADFDKNVAAVCSYFHTNYEYSTDYEIPPGEKPIEWFLTNGKTGHCEYFATAAVMVLRSGGIPTRYVTGFVAAEKNVYGDYWVVRNKCAHAWAEAWDENRKRWIVVEATPADGVPQDTAPGRLSQIWNYVNDRYQVFRVRLHQRGLFWAVRAILSSWSFRLLLGLTLTWLFIRLRRWNRNRAPLVAVRRDPNAQAFQRLLAKVDKRIKRNHGLTRAAHETLTQFANRVTGAIPNAAAAANWYQAYAVARYSPNSAAALPALRESAKNLR